MNSLKQRIDFKDSILYYNNRNDSLTELFYRELIIEKNIITKEETKKCIKEYVKAIQACNPFTIDSYSNFIDTFTNASNNDGHELIRKWINNYIQYFSFYRPINVDDNALSKVVSNNEVMLNIDVIPEELFLSSFDTFFILLCISKDIPGVISKKTRLALTKQLVSNDDDVALKKKGIKRIITNTNTTTTTNKKSNINKKKLLIFDLNGVLIYKKKKRSRSKTFTIRPHAKDFIEAMGERFELAVWTSRSIEKAQVIVDTLFPSNNLLFIWYNDKCDKFLENSGDGDDDDDDDGAPIIHYVKDLEKVWKEYNDYDETNTILLDDSIEKCVMNKSHNCIHPRSFIKKGYSHLKHNIPNSEDDNELHKDNKLFIYLDELSKYNGSISSFINDNNHYNECYMNNNQE